MIVKSHSNAPKTLNIVNKKFVEGNEKSMNISISNRKKYQNSSFVEHPLKSFHLTNPSLMACRNAFSDLLFIMIVFLRQKEQKERCESTLLPHLGIAKHLFSYNSEAHTRRCKHSLSTVDENFKFGDLKMCIKQKQTLPLCLCVYVKRLCHIVVI